MNVKHVKIIFIVLVVLIYIFGIKSANGASAPAVEGDSTTKKGVQTFAFSRAGSADDHKKATKDLMLTVESADVEVITRLIQDGADVNSVNYNGWTPLMLASEINPNSDVIRVLIENGADANAATNKGSTPLMLAARYNSNSDVTRVLIENGADVNVIK